ncbi:hypothetical protein PENTCL1PPCAC_7706, partial [Pristionchus entomophagus]
LFVLLTSLYLFLNSVMESRMDILSLPDVFLRQMMRTMKIKDRLNLRLTCRTFEKLVEETHAGYFREGFITQSSSADPHDSTFSLVIGDQKLDASKKDGLEAFFLLLGRLFNGISFEVFEFRLSGFAFTFPLFEIPSMGTEKVTEGKQVIEDEFLLKFADKLKADKLLFQVDTRAQLRMYACF